MSAKIEILSGTVKARVDGVVENVMAPFTFEGVEFSDPKYTDTDLPDALEEAIATDLQAPAFGSASTPPSSDAPFGSIRDGQFRITAVDGKVSMRVYGEKTSAHPDETFGQPAPETHVTLDPGQSQTFDTVEANAWTVIILQA
jgi:hypothetical protein